MSLEIFFQRESSTFLVVFWALFVVLYGVSAAVGSCSCVTFYVAMRDV
jgi:hypothetical protein